MDAIFSRMTEEYEVEVREYRIKFAAVDTSDPPSLRHWFDEHPYLTNNDNARIAGVSLRTVRRWRLRAGFPPVARRPTVCRRKPRPHLVAPPDWRAGSWLRDQYPLFSIRTIARAIRRSYTATRRLLKRRGVVFPPPGRAARSRHPCCTRRWLWDHYAEGELSLTHCARLARVSRGTMVAWLLRFGIRVRSNTEQQLLNHQRKLRVAKSERRYGSPRPRPLPKGDRV